MLRHRLAWGIVDAVPPYCDEDAVLPYDAVVSHPYLICLCGAPIWEGVTELGAFIYLCAYCKRGVDMRRVA
jgi:hypothetical protein